ncbi:VOC family protein [Sphingomonas sp. LHG3443-2]|uniref:VOC family protein n=1 Tax=Sphingomonas sp. LHG3443-2 TaxID=2804639 RepID=UPI003CEACECA
MTTDLGLTHIALICTDAERTIAFYRRYADMHVVHDRSDFGRRAFWLSDLTRPFAIVFLERQQAESPLGPFGHIGVCLASRELVDQRLAMARMEGLRTSDPTGSGPPVGYWAFIQDPDGHTLELSFGQQVQLHIEAATK